MQQKNPTPTNEELAALMSEMLAELKAHRSKALTPEHLTAVWTDERTWEAALTALGKRVNRRTDEALGGWFRTAAKKIFLFIALGITVYAIGGWQAIAALFKATITH